MQDGEHLIYNLKVSDWTVGILQGDSLLPDPGWEVYSKPDVGEYFVFASPGSEHLMAWVDVRRRDGSIFSTCTVPAYVNVHVKRKRIEIGFLLPELSLPPNIRGR